MLESLHVEIVTEQEVKDKHYTIISIVGVILCGAGFVLLIYDQINCYWSILFMQYKLILCTVACFFK